MSVESGCAFLCQNVFDGVDCADKLGFTYSWMVKSGSDDKLKDAAVYDFRITDTLESGERYFLVAYSFSKGTGNLYFTCPNGFPKEKDIKTDCAKFCGASPSEIVITNIFEFKSKEDYDSFNS